MIRRLFLIFSFAFLTLSGMARANDMCGVVTFRGFGVPAAVNAGWARVQLYWDEIEQIPGQYWSSGYVRTDAMVGRSNVMPSIAGFSRAYQNGMPADSVGAYTTACGATDWQTTLNAWQALWANATARYCGQIRYWSVWNEPNAPGFLRPRIECSHYRGWCDDPANIAACRSSAAADYADLVRYADLGRGQGCPGASLVVGEVAQDTGTYQYSFLNQVLSTIYPYGVSPAVVSVHTYDTSWGSRMQIGNYRSYVNSYFPSAAIWLTETGGPSLGVNLASCQASQWNPLDLACWGGQADFDRAILNENRQYGAQYNWQRTFIYRAELPDELYGITYVDGSGNPTDSFGNPSRNLQVEGLSSACGNGLLAYGYADDEKAACNAIATSSPATCDQIDNGSANSLNVRMMCRALAGNSPTPCASITNADMRLACQGMSSRNTFYCVSIGDASQRSFCSAVAAQNYTLCSGVTDRNTQLLCYAMSNGINTNCRDITLPNSRNFCYGVSSHNASYCSSIVSQTGRIRQ